MMANEDWELMRKIREERLAARMEEEIKAMECPSCNGLGHLVPPACSWDEDDRICYRCGGTGKRKP